VTGFECHKNTLLSRHGVQDSPLHGSDFRRGVEGNHKVILACCFGRKVLGLMPETSRPQQDFILAPANFP